MISIEECNSILLRELLEPNEEILIDIEESVGRIVSTDVKSPINYPNYPRSMMDGYAVHHTTEPGVYDVEEDIHADVIPSLSNIKVRYIATGATLPENCDSVIKIEDTEKVEGNKVKLNVKPKKGQYLRMIGSDIKINQVLKKKGHRIGISDIGVFATCGIRTVPVYNDLFSSKFGVMSTGDEVVDHKEPYDPKSRKIRDCNRILHSLELKDKLRIKNVVDFGIQKDDYESLKKSIISSLVEVDYLFTTGGVSMGIRDFVRPILHEIGKVHFEKVSIKPGKPFTFSTILPDPKKNDFKNKKFIFALPGNPVSALTCLRVLIIPALEKTNGAIDVPKKTVKVPVKLMENVKRNPVREEYIRSVVFWNQDHFIGFSTGNQNSSRLLSMQDCNGYIVLPKGDGLIRAGRTVTCELFGKFQNFDESRDDHLKMVRNKKKVVRSCGCDHTEEEDEEELTHHHHHHHHQSQSSIGKKKKKTTTTKFLPKFGVLTVSDRSSKGEYDDVSGPLIRKILEEENGWEFKTYKIVPDEKEEIKKVLIEWSSREKIVVDVIFTTGGTGFSDRDVTPEATQDVIQRDASGLIHGIQSLILPKIPMAMLSRATAGIRNKTLIINLPGKPKACRENLEILIQSRIDHGIQILTQ